MVNKEKEFMKTYDELLKTRSELDTQKDHLKGKLKVLRDEMEGD